MGKWLLVAVLAVVPYGPVVAQDAYVYTFGNNLLTDCRNKTSGFDVGVCKGYIIAIADVLNNNTVSGHRACLPENVTKGQVIDIVVPWLEAHPQHRHFTANSLVALALSEAFPCR